MSIPEAITELKERDQWVAFTRSKVPVGPRGGHASSVDPETWGSCEDAKFIRSVQQLPGVGFVFSPDDPYVGIDLDDAIDPVSGLLKPWALEVCEALNSYTEFSPSGMGVHVWVRGSIPRAGARKDDGRKIEVYAQGRYFTVTGKPVPGFPTTIENRELGAWFESHFGGPRQVDEVRRDFSPGVFETEGIEDWIEEALRHIPANDYHDWLKVGMALKYEFGDRGFSLWDSWSASSQKYDGPRATAAKWESFQGDGVTTGSLVWLAEMNGFEIPRGPVIPEAFRHGWEDWLEQQQGVSESAGMREGLELRLVDVAELYVDRTPFEPDLIGPGVLGTGDMMLLFGPPKSMKSMVIMDMFRNFAMGKDWCGLKPLRPLKTLYAQFEVKLDQFRKRIQLADMTRDEVEAMRGNFMVTDRFTPMLNADFVASFAEQALRTFAGDLDVLILDPLANIFSGDNENDNTQMSAFIRQIKYLRNAIDPKVAIVLVHHSNKIARQDRQAEPFGSLRGASSLRGAYDAGMYLDREREEVDEVKMWFELRNGPRKQPVMLDFAGGRFEMLNAAAERTEDLVVPSGDAPSTPNTWPLIQRTLVEEATAGRVHTRTGFAATFADMRGFGSSSTIKRHIKELCITHHIAVFQPEAVGDGDVVEQLGPRAEGYLTVRGMTLNRAGHLYSVEPSQIMGEGEAWTDVLGW